MIGKSWLVLAWALAGVAVTPLAQPQAADQRAARAAQYAALAELPDWSGWWGHRVPLPGEWAATPPPFRPEALAAAVPADVDPQRFCKPPQFTGSSGGFTEAVEFLFTPGRVTLTNEYGLIRRIYTDGAKLPEDPQGTNAGTSVGRWDGATFVVETTGLNPAARYPPGAPRVVPIGADVRITERIFLKDPSTLQIDVVTVAPDVLTGPDRRTRLYTRVAKTMGTEVTFCADDDRSLDQSSGQQRFDMTPPANLPPPPPR